MAQKFKSDVAFQGNAAFPNQSASKAAQLDSSGNLTSSSVTTTELGYLSGVTSGIQSQLGSKIASSEKGANSGVATLDSGGKIPVSQLPASLMEYQGLWNASTNSPTLADGTGTSGFFYRVNVAGTQNLGSGSQTFVVGDWVMYDGSIWQKAHSGADTVISVNGASGVVTVNAINQLTGDVTTSAASSSQSLASTVASVGGSSAANVHSAELLANAATNANTASAIVKRDSSGNFSAGTITANLTGNASGTAGNITASTNSTITTLSSLSLPGSQVTGNISGNAANITATSNSTLTTLSSLSLPGSQVSGNISGNAANVTGVVAIANGGTNSSTALTNSKVMVSSGGAIVESSTTTTQLSYLDATSSIQTQLNSKIGLAAGDIADTLFSAANNQSSAANVTGLAFSNAVTRSFVAQVSVTTVATANLYEQFELRGIQRASDWVFNVMSIGDNSGVTFSITSAGQIQYTSPNNAGFVSCKIHFSASTLAI